MDIRSIRARFSAPVYPGEMLRTEIWRDSENDDHIAFRCSVPQRGVVVLNNGAAVIAAHADTKNRKEVLHGA